MNKKYQNARVMQKTYFDVGGLIKSNLHWKSMAASAEAEFLPSKLMYVRIYLIPYFVVIVQLHS